MAMATGSEIASSSTGGAYSGKGRIAYALRAALVPTTGLIASSHMPVGGYASVGVLITYVDADYTSLELGYEVSIDGTVWAPLPANDALSSGYFPAYPYRRSFTLANQESATGWSIADVVSVTGGWQFFRVKVKRTGGTAVGTVAITGIGGGMI